MSTTQEIVAQDATKEERDVGIQPQTTLNIIAQAIEKKVDVETLERLFELQKDYEQREAKKAFIAAMAKCQSELPTIRKTKEVLEKDRRTVRYKYASIDAIVEQVREYIARNGLSYTIKTQQDDTSVTATVIVTHEGGHSEETSFRVPIDPKAYMSGPQKFAAALTFAKRYAFCNAFGIMTGDEDTDATPETVGNAQVTQPKVTKEALERLYSLMNELGTTQGVIESQIGMPLASANINVLRKVYQDLERIRRKRAKEAANAPATPPAAPAQGPAQNEQQESVPDESPKEQMQHTALCASHKGAKCDCIPVVNDNQ